MTNLPVVRVAAAQATPVVLDAAATLDKAVRLLQQAADGGVQLVVFPETFVSLYPSYVWANGAANDALDDLWGRLWAASVDVPGPMTDRLVDVCRQRGLHCAIGVNERESERPGTLYNTLITIGPGGILGKHRKLMPTYHERLFHGFGDGSDLDVHATPLGRLGGLICWENRMPLARYALYQKGVQIWVAPTADDSGGWLASMRHIAIESGAFVVSVPQFIPRSAFPPDFPVPLPEVDVFGRGGAAIIAPGGDVIGGPLYDEEGMVVADCDLQSTLRAKRWFDVVGHYARADVLAPGKPAVSQQVAWRDSRLPDGPWITESSTTASDGFGSAAAAGTSKA